MFPKAILAAAVLFAAIAVTAHASQAPITIVMAGQSNMDGYGPLPAVPAPSNPKVKVLINGAWEPLTEPLPDPGNPTIAAGYGSGPAVTIGNEIVRRTGRDVRLIPCAYPGSFLSDWVPGGQWYERCVQRIGSLRVDGVMFLQGAQDATDPGLAATWAARFATFVTGIRSVVGQAPVVFGQIGAYYNDPAFGSWATVQQQQALFRAVKTRMVVTDDLLMQPGSLHFSLQAYRSIGARMADAWLNLTGLLPRKPRCG